MSLSLILACLWALSANVTAMLPSRHHHWPAAYVLMALGLPLAVFIFWQHGPWVMMLCLVAAGSLLRWPVYYAWRRLRG